MKLPYTNFIIYTVVMATTMAAVISSSHATSQEPHPHHHHSLSDIATNMAASSSDASFLSHLLSDLKSARLIHACRQYIGHLRRKSNPTPSHSSGELQPDILEEMSAVPYGSIPRYNPENRFDNKLTNILHDIESSSGPFQAALSSVNLNHLPTSSSDLSADEKFPVFSSNNINNNNDVSSDFDKNVFEIMEQMCLKYAFDKLLQSQQRDEYLASKKALKDSNDFFDPADLQFQFQYPDKMLPEYDNENSLSFTTPEQDSIRPHLSTRFVPHSDSARLAYNDGFRLPHRSYSNVENVLKRSSPPQLRESENNDDGDDEDFMSRVFSRSSRRAESINDEYDNPPLKMTSSKRGYPAFWKWIRQARAKRHRMSINNAMMTLSASIWQEQERRKQHNQKNMISSMMSQG